MHLLKEWRSEEHTSELQSRFEIVCRLLLEKIKHLNWKMWVLVSQLRGAVIIRLVFQLDQWVRSTFKLLWQNWAVVDIFLMRQHRLKMRLLKKQNKNCLMQLMNMKKKMIRKDK